jgi:hypothetical protein
MNHVRITEMEPILILLPNDAVHKSLSVEEDASVKELVVMLRADAVPSHC